jgi:hypothetical protein
LKGENLFRNFLACVVTGLSALLYPVFPIFIACLSASLLSKNVKQGAFVGAVGSFLGVLFYSAVPHPFPPPDSIFWFAFDTWGYQDIIIGLVLGSLGGYAARLWQKQGQQRLSAWPTAFPRRSPSLLWYLLPIFLLLVGGMMGFVVLRNRDPGMARNMLILGIVTTLLASYMLGFGFVYGKTFH